MVENPMVIEPCAKLYNYAKWYDDDNGYCGGNDEFEKVIKINFGIDTSELTVEEEFNLINAMELLSRCSEDDIIDYERESWFEVNPRETPDLEDDEVYGYVEVIGSAKESVYDDLFDLLKSYDVDFTED